MADTERRLLRHGPFLSLPGVWLSRTGTAISMNLTRLVGRMFMRIVRRYPIVFAGFAMVGQYVGVIILMQPDDKAAIPLGLLCIAFYSGLFIVLIVKLRRGTWDASCEWGEWLFSSDGPWTPTYVARKRAMPCPSCGQPLGNRKPGRIKTPQRIWGGWTCPDCDCDIDLRGNLRPPKAGS